MDDYGNLRYGVVILKEEKNDKDILKKTMALSDAERKVLADYILKHNK